MKNQEIAKIFYELADYLEMERVQFKPFAYQKAAIALETLKEDAEEIYERGGLKALKEIPGVGESIALKIDEYLKTGKIKYYEDFKRKIPVNLEEIIAVEGMGPQKAKILYEKLGIKTIQDLEKAAKANKVAPLFGFGEKTEKNILEGIEFLKRSKGRFLLGEILPKVKDVSEKLRNLKEVQKIDVAGSVRRLKETIGDVDFLVISDKPEKVMDFFVSLPGIIKIWGRGKTKASVRLREGFDPHTKFGVGVDMDIRVVPSKSYGSALQYFTGSKEHNIVLRRIAMNKGLKLSEYGLFRGPNRIAGRTEEEIYEALGIDYIEPEMRENQGEVELAQKRKLPKLIGYRDIKGDLHCHSNWDGGADSIEEIAGVAQEMGYEYVGISDHTKFLRIEHGLDEKQLAQQRKEIDKINAKIQMLAPYRTRSSGAGSNVKLNPKSKFQILQGCEANILNDGSIDIKDDALAKLDYVIAGIHSNFKMPKEKMTERIIRAMKNPHLDIISHPTGRLIKKRDEYQIDFDKILRVAKETGTILEINSFPVRLDLNDRNIRLAKERGVKMVINTDAHRKDQLRFIEFGVSQARRGWAEKKDIINTQPLEKLLEFF